MMAGHVFKERKTENIDDLLLTSQYREKNCLVCRAGSAVTSQLTNNLSLSSRIDDQCFDRLPMINKHRLQS